MVSAAGLCSTTICLSFVMMKLVPMLSGEDACAGQLSTPTSLTPWYTCRKVKKIKPTNYKYTNSQMCVGCLCVYMCACNLVPCTGQALGPSPAYSPWAVPLQIFAGRARPGPTYCRPGPGPNKNINTKPRFFILIKTDYKLYFWLLNVYNYFFSSA